MGRLVSRCNLSAPVWQVPLHDNGKGAVGTTYFDDKWSTNRSSQQSMHLCAGGRLVVYRLNSRQHARAQSTHLTDRKPLHGHAVNGKQTVPGHHDGVGVAFVALH